MLGQHKLIVDEWAEVWDLLQPYADASFWQWPAGFDPRAVYIVGRVVLKENWNTITELANRYPGRIVFSNPAEGSETILLQLKRLRITEYVRDGRIGLLTSGDLESGWDYCKTDCYFTNIVNYIENQQAATFGALTQNSQRSYSFLFLNGRLRPHRKWLINGLRGQGLLNQALWTNLGSKVELPFTSQLDCSINPYEPVRLLPAEYEIERAVPNLATVNHNGFCKHELFNNTWGDAIVNPRCYTDTWFSLVTETIFDYPHTFRTEKIWKPILMAHPFIVAANPGYLKSLRAAGFMTFGHFIDERYDEIDSPHYRIERIIDSIKFLVREGVEHFWHATRSVCKYNQQHLAEYNRSERARLPELLEKYLDERS